MSVLRSIIGDITERTATDDEVKMCSRGPHNAEPLIILNDNHDVKKKNLVLYTSCHAIQLAMYFDRYAKVGHLFNIVSLLVHRFLQEHVDPVRTELSRRLIKNACLVMSHPFIGQYEPMNMSYYPDVAGRLHALFPPPNNAAFWPVVQHFGEGGVRYALNNGQTVSSIISDFREGRFQPLFHNRYHKQRERLLTRERDTAIKIVDFMDAYHKRCKLWFTDNHPTFNMMAWIGSRAIAMLGMKPDDEKTCSAYPSDAASSWNAFPETNYEFSYYGFTYPKRYTNVWNGEALYEDWIKAIAGRWKPNEDHDKQDGLSSYL